MFHFSHGCIAPIDLPSMGASAPTAPGKSAPMYMTLTFNPLGAMVSHAIVQDQRSLDSEDRVETNRQRDRRMKAIALPPSLMRSVITECYRELFNHYLTTMHVTVSELKANLLEKESVLVKINKELENLNEFKVNYIFSQLQNIPFYMFV